MKKVVKVDNQGLFIEDVILKDDAIIPENCIETPCPEGLFLPKWNGREWVEGLTQEEIDEIKNQSQNPTGLDILKQENEKLQKQLASINSDLQGFMDFYFTTL